MEKENEKDRAERFIAKPGDFVIIKPPPAKKKKTQPKKTGENTGKK